MKKQGLKKRLSIFLSATSIGKQLLWWISAIGIVLLALWIIGCVCVKGIYPLSEMLSMFLDPGNFKADENISLINYAFRFIVTVFGLLLLSAILISLVTNMFENLSESYRNGTAHFKHNDHILILGAGHQLGGIMHSLYDMYRLNKTECKFYGKEIVIVSDCDIEELRNDTFDKLGAENDKDFLESITFHHGSRDNSSILSEVSALHAAAIYIIGEDNEEGHDLLSVKCCDNLIDLFNNEENPSDIRVNCYLVLNDRTSIDIFKYLPLNKTGRLNIEAIDEYEHLCKSVIAYDHDNDDVHYPILDYYWTETGDLDNTGGTKSYKQVRGIKEDSENHVHFVIAGMTQVARAMAMTAANICHFPNFKDGKNRTVITFVCKDIKNQMSQFISRYRNLFTLSHHTFITFDDKGERIEEMVSPSEEYGDFMDIEWEFIEGELTDPNLQKLLKEWSCDKYQSLSLAICLDSQMDSASTAISLPDEIYNKEKKIPIFVYQRLTEKLICKARKSGHYGNIYAFGMDNELKKDPLYENKEGKRINFIYTLTHKKLEDIKSLEKEWEGELREGESSHLKFKTYEKLSSISSAESIFMKLRSFPIKYDGSDATSIPEASLKALSETEHRRWMTSVLLLGNTPMTILEREKLEYKIDRDYLEKCELGEMSDRIDAAKEFLKKDYKDLFIHYDLTPDDKLMKIERASNTDEGIVKNIKFILGETDTVKYKTPEGERSIDIKNFK